MAERRQSASAQVTEASTLELVTGSAPAVKLDDKHYKLVDKVPPPPFPVQQSASHRPTPECLVC